VQSANATNSSSDRAALQAEVSQLSEEIDRVATQTDFNGTKLLDGSFSAQAFQVGANAGQTITIDSIASARTSTLGKFNGVNVANNAVASPSNTPAAMTVAFTGGSLGTVNLGNVANDAKAIANALNASGIAGMSASADPAVATGSQLALGGLEVSEGLSFTLNGTNIEVAAAPDSTTRLNDLVTAINAQTGTTGVTAAVTSGALTLTSVSGSGDINIGGDDATVVLAQTGLTVQDNLATPGTSQLGFTGLDISTTVGVDNAILAMDAALTVISSSRADLGAIQNRFMSTIENLSITAENLTASRSRIMDADFAAETAALSRAQILQQAGTAMVAQANQVPQGVLQLLQG
jgi:flagellin